MLWFGTLGDFNFVFAWYIPRIFGEQVKKTFSALPKYVSQLQSRRGLVFVCIVMFNLLERCIRFSISHLDCSVKIVEKYILKFPLHSHTIDSLDI